MEKLATELDRRQLATVSALIGEQSFSLLARHEIEGVSYRALGRETGEHWNTVFYRLRVAKAILRRLQDGSTEAGPVPECLKRWR